MVWTGLGSSASYQRGFVSKDRPIGWIRLGFCKSRYQLTKLWPGPTLPVNPFPQLKVPSLPVSGLLEAELQTFERRNHGFLGPSGFDCDGETEALKTPGEHVSNACNANNTRRETRHVHSLTHFSVFEPSRSFPLLIY